MPSIVHTHTQWLSLNVRTRSDYRLIHLQITVACVNAFTFFLFLSQNIWTQNGMGKLWRSWNDAVGKMDMAERCKNPIDEDPLVVSGILMEFFSAALLILNHFILQNLKWHHSQNIRHKYVYNTITFHSLESKMIQSSSSVQFLKVFFLSVK